MEKVTKILDGLQMLFNRLSSREKMLVLTALGAVTVMIVTFIIIGVNSSLNGLKDRMETKQESYEKVLNLKSRYQNAKKDLQKFKNEIGNSKNTLMQDIGGLAQENGIEVSQVVQSKGAIDRKAKIREESVKIEIRRVELAPLLRFLESIEKKNKLFFIEKLNMKRRYDAKEQLDVSFNVSTLIALEEEE